MQNWFLEHICQSLLHKRVKIGSNNLNIEDIVEVDHHKCLETDESVSVIGPLNKEKVHKKYKLRVKTFGTQS